MKFIWTTKEGDKMYVHEMETRHLENCINYFKDRIYKQILDDGISVQVPAMINGKYIYKWLAIFKKELERRKQQTESRTVHVDVENRNFDTVIFDTKDVIQVTTNHDNVIIELERK